VSARPARPVAVPAAVAEAARGSRLMAEIRFLGCDNDVFCSSIQARAAEFEQATGHQLTVRLLDNDFYYANKLADFLGGEHPADVYMSGPVLAWEQLGLGFVLAIPVNWESYNLAYLPDILACAGVDVPGTWAEYFAAAMAIPERVPGARGFGQRGAEAWHTVYTGFATQLWSCGGRDFDPGGSCAIASEAAVEAARTLSDAIRAAGPADWTS